MPKIINIKAREIFNSRGYPTLEVDIYLKCGAFGRAQVPSGASKGQKEALELLDVDQARLEGKGMLKAIKNVNQVIANALIGKEIKDQKELDDILINLDGTQNKSKIGANAILGTSLAFCKAFAKSCDQNLYQVFARLISGKDFAKSDYFAPMPMLNVINGGMHADNKLAIQEFMLLPVGFKTFKESIVKSAEVFYRLKSILKKNNYSINVGDEGGFAPNINSTEEALEILTKAIGADSDKIKIALDCAASTFFYDKKYHVDQELFSSDQIVDFYQNLTSKYQIVSLEDPIEENDEYGWRKITELLGKKIAIIGDDLFVTNPKILQSGIDTKLANSVLIKMNQIGTITETIECIKLAKQNGYSIVISHRSGETEDTSIAHLAVACGRGAKIKSGCLTRSERVAKYNELLRIEESILN